MQIDSHRNRRINLGIGPVSISVETSDKQKPRYSAATPRTPPLHEPSHKAAMTNRGRFCHRADEDAVVEVDGVKIRPWFKVRRQNLRQLRKMTRFIVLLMAWMEVIRVGPAYIVYAGKEGYAGKGPEDYGIAYNVGYFLSWLYVCLFMIVWVPLFSWWVPMSRADDSNGEPAPTSKYMQALTRLDIILFQFLLCYCLVRYTYYAIKSLIYVDDVPVSETKGWALPKNTKKNWLVRLMMILGVVLSMTFGYGALQILDVVDLAHIKKTEYLLIVLPVQANIGLMMGSAMQYGIERRIEKMNALKKLQEERAQEAVLPVADEKAALLL